MPLKKDEIVQRLDIEGVYDYVSKKTLWPLRKEVLEEYNKLLLIEVTFVADSEGKLYTISIVANPLGLFFVPRNWHSGEANPVTFEEASGMEWVEMFNGTPAVWIDGVLYLETK